MAHFFSWWHFIQCSIFSIECLYSQRSKSYHPSRRLNICIQYKITFASKTLCFYSIVLIYSIAFCCLCLLPVCIRTYSSTISLVVNKIGRRQKNLWSVHNTFTQWHHTLERNMLNDVSFTCCSRC